MNTHLDHREPSETEALTKLVEPHAARLDFWCERYGVAIDTLNKLLPTGRGPEIFTIGRRRFCLRSAWHDWLDRLARTGGVRVTTTQDAAPRPVHRNLRGRPRTSTLVARSEPAAD